MAAGEPAQIAMPDTQGQLHTPQHTWHFCINYCHGCDHESLIMNVDQVIGAFTAASTRREELKRMQKARPGGVGGAARRGVLATDRVVGGVLKGLKDRLQDKMLGALPEEAYTSSYGVRQPMGFAEAAPETAPEAEAEVVSQVAAAPAEMKVGSAPTAAEVAEVAGASGLAEGELEGRIADAISALEIGVPVDANEVVEKASV